MPFNACQNRVSGCLYVMEDFAPFFSFIEGNLEEPTLRGSEVTFVILGDHFKLPAVSRTVSCATWHGDPSSFMPVMVAWMDARLCKRDAWVCWRFPKGLELSIFFKNFLFMIPTKKGPPDLTCFLHNFRNVLGCFLIDSSDSSVFLYKKKGFIKFLIPGSRRVKATIFQKRVVLPKPWKMLRKPLPGQRMVKLTRSSQPSFFKDGGKPTQDF